LVDTNPPFIKIPILFNQQILLNHKISPNAKNRPKEERSSLQGGFSALGWSWWDLNPRPDKALASFLHA